MDKVKNGHWELLEEGDTLLPSDQWLLEFDDDGMPIWQPKPDGDDQITVAVGELWRRWVEQAEPRMASLEAGAEPLSLFCAQGPSRRDVLAGMAMQGLLSNPKLTECPNYPEATGIDAIALADALTQELDNPTAPTPRRVLGDILIEADRDPKLKAILDEDGLYGAGCAATGRSTIGEEAADA